MKLDAQYMTKFKCLRSKLPVGINLPQLYKSLKSMERDDNLTLTINKENKHLLNIRIENPDLGSLTLDTIKLMDLTVSELKIPPTKFEAKVTISAHEFFKTCKEMHSLEAEFVEIKCTNNKLTFKCKGESSRMKMYVHSDKIKHNVVSIMYPQTTAKEPKIVKGLYELKNIVSFNKFAPLCTAIELYMKNNYPLGVMFTIARLGKLIVFFSPYNPEGDEEYDDDLYDDDYYFDDYYFDDDYFDDASATNEKKAF